SSFSTSSSFSSSPILISLKHWLKKPHAFPFLLLAFLLLTWLSLLLQHSSLSWLDTQIGDSRKFDDDWDVNLVRFGSGSGIGRTIVTGFSIWYLLLLSTGLKVELVLVRRFMWAKSDPVR
ncbi:hypothetical protein LINPERPRIM_LOCUS25095, partial [Linum perenne]